MSKLVGVAEAGEGFGSVLDRLSAQTTAQGAERNRLHAAGFHCRNCHFIGHADTVGAVNVERRHTDPELRERIQVFTPKEVVLKSLREIFERKRALST